MVAVLEPLGPDEVLAEIEAQLGRFLFFSGRPDEAFPHLEQALTLAEMLDLRETFVQALNSKSVLTMHKGRMRESRILIEGALEVALANDLHSAALRAYNNLSVLLWMTDEWEANVRNIDRGLDLARRIGHRNWEANFTAGSIGTLQVLGRWDEAMARAAEAQELASSEFARGLLLYIVYVLVNRGSLKEAREFLLRHEDVSHSENPDFAGGYASIESVLLRAEENPRAALAAAERALALDSSLTGIGRLFLIEALESAALLDDLDRLRAGLAAIEALPPGQLARSLRAHRARFRARLPEADPVEELETAAQIFGDLEMVFHLARTRFEHAQVLLALDRTAEAEPLLAAALETFEQLGAAPWIERAKQLESRTLVS